jgi:hypothetical protein
MSLEGLSRVQYRRLDNVRGAAAYADTHGGILAVNDEFRDLWSRCSGGDRPEGRTLFRLFDGDDGRDICDIVTAVESPPRSLTLAVRLVPGGVTMNAEFAPIARKSRPGLIWLVRIHSSPLAPRHFNPNTVTCARP